LRPGRGRRTSPCACFARASVAALDLWLGDGVLGCRSAVTSALAAVTGLPAVSDDGTIESRTLPCRDERGPAPGPTISLKQKEALHTAARRYLIERIAALAPEPLTEFR